jgi:Xaa-Pro aminopeptidase
MTLIQEKIKPAAGLLGECGVDCWITFTRESEICGDPTLVFLAPGPVTWHSAFIAGADGRTRAIVGLYDKKGVEETGAYDTVVGYVTGIKEPLLEYLRETNPKTIAVNYSKMSEICDGLTHGMYLTLHDFLAEAGMGERLQSAQKIVSALRERKSAAEIGWMKEAVRETEEIFASVTRFITPGKTEKDIADFILAEAAHRNLPTAWGQATCPAVFSGPETAQAHYSPTGRVVERGHILNMDFGVKVEGYCSDMQRTFYILAPGEIAAPEDVMKGFRTIVLAVEESKKAIRPGIEGHAIDAVARSIIVEAGYAEFPHALGHQVGRYAHDGTALLGPSWEKYAQKPFQKLEEGMVFTIEPRLTVPGRGVITIEEMVVVTKDGAEWMGRPQRDIILIK